MGLEYARLCAYSLYTLTPEINIINQHPQLIGQYASSISRVWFTVLLVGKSKILTLLLRSPNGPSLF